MKELGPELLTESRRRNLGALRTKKESASGVLQARRDVTLRQLSEVRDTHGCWTGALRTLEKTPTRRSLNTDRVAERRA
jgi:hypothetical protein